MWSPETRSEAVWPWQHSTPTGRISQPLFTIHGLTPLAWQSSFSGEAEYLPRFQGDYYPALGICGGTGFDYRAWQGLAPDLLAVFYLYGRQERGVGGFEAGVAGGYQYVG